MKSICIFGDSVSWGAWDLEKGGWVSRLWFDVAGRDEDKYVEIYNCSISGGTSETILKRFENEAKIRSADTLIFQTGGNDASYEGEKFLVDLEAFKGNIEEIIKRAKKITPNIVFTDLRNCDETKTMPVSWADVFYTNENIKRYLKIMREVCEENNVFFLELDLLTAEDFEDGLHPNARGHEKIFMQIKNFLLNYGWI